MKASFKFILIFIISTLNLLASYAQETASVADQAKWLIGTWENHTSRGTMYEEWNNHPEGLTGRLYMIKEGDTAILETLKINEKAGKLLYIATIKNQNEGKPVVFVSSFVSPSKFIAEAPTHDYPKTISYTRIGENELVAEISGPRDGKQRYQAFSMKRTPENVIDNIKIVKKVFEYFNQHEWEKMAELYAEPANFLDPSYGIEPVSQTQSKIVAKYQELHQFSSDIRDEVTAIYPSGDKQVIVEFISSGTAPDGSTWKLPVASIFTIENGLITKDHTYYDKD